MQSILMKLPWQGGIAREWRRPLAADNLKFEAAFGCRQPQGQRIALAISFAKCHPYNKYYPNQMKNLDAKTFKKKKIKKKKISKIGK